MVGLAGMIPELFLASLCALLWANTGPGLLNSLAYNIMVVASVSTLVFNLNPLLRFDGYYVLADLTDSPNLQRRAAREWGYLFEHHGFGLKIVGKLRAARAASDFWLAVYGVASWSYRMFVTVVIILLVADRYLGIGAAAGAVTFVGSFVLPAVGLCTYLLRDPRLTRVRKRAWLVSAPSAALAVILLLGAVPLPHHFRAPGQARAAGLGRKSAPAWTAGCAAGQSREPNAVEKGAEVPDLKTRSSTSRSPPRGPTSRSRWPGSARC